jgi:hypothetical protein
MSDIKMRGPEDCAPSLSFAGDSYTADKKGLFTVPVEAYGPLIAQGFTAVGDVPDEVQS